MEKKNKFSKNLRLLRIESGISQEDLARAIQVSRGVISFWENGLREPGMSSLIALANFFNCTIDYLVGRED